MNKPLFIVDGYGILFRTYYSVGEMNTSQNVPVGGVFGFIRAFFTLILRYNVEKIVITLDSGKPTFRAEIYKEYKANRVKVPESLVPQFSILDEFLQASNIGHIRKDGFEADDLIASLVKANGGQNVIVSSDKDLMQLVSQDTRYLDFFANKFYQKEDVLAKFGVLPEFIADYLAIVGDTSDNVPGIKGCGPQKAVKLINEFGSLENIVANIENIRDQRLKNMMQNNVESGIVSKQLVMLDSSIPIDSIHFNIDAINVNGALDFLQKYEMKSLINMVEKIRKKDRVPEGSLQKPEQGSLF
jgi:DNA polymerase-1